MSITAAEIPSLIGQTFAPSEWFVIDQARIDAFAAVTFDHQFIHVDPERAASTPLGTTIAHGFLTLSLLGHLTSKSVMDFEGLAMGMNYGCNRLRFVTPVRVNSQLRATRTLKSVEERGPKRLLLTYAVTVEIRDEPKPALAMDWLHLLVFN
jgi:acyl dehydratase